MDLRKTTVLPPLPTTAKPRRKAPPVAAKTVFAVQGLWLGSKLTGVLLSLLFHTLLMPLLSTVIRDPWWLQTARIGGLLLLTVIDRLIFAPFQLGFYAFWYDVAAERHPTVSVCFEAYRRRRYRLSLRYAFCSLFYRLVTAVLCTAPSLALLTLSDVLWAAADSVAPLGALCCRAAGWLFLSAGAFLWAVLTVRFSATVFFLPESGRVLTAARRSLTVTKGHSGALLWLYIRFAAAFLLWFLLLPVWLILPRFYRSFAQKIQKFSRLANADHL